MVIGDGGSSGATPIPSGAEPARKRLARWVGQRRVLLLLFAFSFFQSAYFCQATGWNGGIRFAQVRALVEGWTFAVNGYARYTAVDTPSGRQPRRSPVGPLRLEDLCLCRSLRL